MSRASLVAFQNSYLAEAEVHWHVSHSSFVTYHRFIIIFNFLIIQKQSRFNNVYVFNVQLWSL